jgi:hypothetical protein
MREFENSSAIDVTRMKMGPFLGCLGCMLWGLSVAIVAISSKAGWIGLAVGVAAVALLIAGTIITGVQKRRILLGMGLSLFSAMLGVGFLIMLLVPKRELQSVA